MSTSPQVAVLPPGVPEKPAIAIDGAGADELSVSPDGNELAWRDVQFGLHDLQHGVSVEQVSDGRRTDILGDEWPAWFSDTEVTMGGPNGGDGGWVDTLLSRITDIFFGIPLLLGSLVILSAFTNRTVWTVVFALAVPVWMASQC